MKISVTGAGGYIGSNVIRELSYSNNDIIAVDNNTKFIPASQNAKNLSVDLFSDNIIKNPYEELGKPDTLIHLAWRDGFVHNSDAHMDDLSEHIKLIRNYILGGRNISIMGSMHEVGYIEGMISENTYCSPLNQYGVAKLALRQWLELYSKQWNEQNPNDKVYVKWLRAYYIFGDDYNGSSIFAKIMRAAMSGQKKFPFTTGKNKYDFINVKDLAKQIVAASLQTDVVGTIEVCSGNLVSLADQIEWYIKDQNLDIELDYGKFPDREYDSPVVYGDNSKIQKILNI